MNWGLQRVWVRHFLCECFGPNSASHLCMLHCRYIYTSQYKWYSKNFYIVILYMCLKRGTLHYYGVLCKECVIFLPRYLLCIVDLNLLYHIHWIHNFFIIVIYFLLVLLIIPLSRFFFWWGGDQWDCKPQQECNCITVIKRHNSIKKVVRAVCDVSGDLFIVLFYLFLCSFWC